MSHVVALEAVIDDLPALAAACRRIEDLEFVPNQKNFEWYGRWVNDYNAQDAAYKLGIDPKDYGKCDHAIRQSKDGGYEIGLVKVAGQSGYKMVFDFYEHRLTQKVGGQTAPKLMQLYQVEKAKNQAKKLGYTKFQEKTLQDGSIQVVINR